MITVTCTYCGLKILVPETVRGRQGTCLNCGSPITVTNGVATDAAQSLSFKPGDRIGERYSLLAYIGRGGMGVVYHAEDALVKEEVALKFLRPNVLRTEKGRRFFLQEAQIARRLRHENIIAVHDVGFTNDGVLYLSMEYAHGQSLRALMLRHREARRYIPVRLIITIALQVLDALHYAHRLVVHRDIKPENIMLLPNERVKVLDFGLAIAIEEENTQSEEKSQSVERKRRVIGTLAYASPEQINHKPVDLRADIFALGLVLRELITLRTPLELAVDEPIKRDDVPPGIVEVINRAVREDKSERWHSAQAFRNALNEAYQSAYHVADVSAKDTNDKQTCDTSGMIFFEGGNFLMGNNAVREEAPEAEVHVEPFYMDKYPVTVAQYATYLKDTGAEEPGCWRDPQYNGPDQPVVGVSWYEAAAYAAWAGKQLPSEMQWEFAARGRENRRYPWGQLPPDNTRCNFRNYLGMPSMVSMHEDGQTPEGVFDMAGNVYEWTLDPYAPYTRLREGALNPADGPRKSTRGGCFESNVEEITTTARKGFFPNERKNNMGFRCVAAVKESAS